MTRALPVPSSLVSECQNIPKMPRLRYLCLPLLLSKFQANPLKLGHREPINFFLKTLIILYVIICHQEQLLIGSVCNKEAFFNNLHISQY